MTDHYVPYDNSDEKYILTEDQDDLVQVWSMDDLKVVAWVSGVASDSHWFVSNSDGNGELVLYRFGSVEGISGTISLHRRCKINQQLHEITFLEQFKATNLHSKYFIHIFRDVAVSQ
ncbi:hypothetical protein ACFE04_021016 [Oxalis oulophora]